MKRSCITILAITFCLLILLSACNRFDAPTILDLDAHPTKSDTSSKDNSNVSDVQSHNIVDEETYGVTLEFNELTRDLVEGKLLYTITAAKAITHTNEIPAIDAIDPETIIWQPDGSNIIDYSYPDFVNEDGSFLPNCYLILVDVSVESQNATAITRLNSEGQYEDPYTFRADRLTLVDLSNTDTAGFFYVEEVDYFSNYAECSEHPLAFRLEPGDKKEFTLGWFIGGYKYDGSLTKLSNLCLCDTYGNPDSTLVKLGLGE